MLKVIQLSTVKRELFVQMVCTKWWQGTSSTRIVPIPKIMLWNSEKVKMKLWVWKELRVLGDTPPIVP